MSRIEDRGVRIEAKAEDSHESCGVAAALRAAPSIPNPQSSILVKRLGRADYLATWRAMQAFTSSRSEHTPDEIWIVEHPPVYTLGIAAKAEHLPREDNGIPVVKTDRGGQITYHGPGQIVAYLLLDVRRRNLAVRPLVRIMENAVIALLADFGIAASGRKDAPGVYVGEAKIAAVGLRIRNGCSYHGLAFNADMDLSPFRAINPCGYAGLAVTQARDLGITEPMERLGARLAQHLAHLLDA